MGSGALEIPAGLERRAADLGALVARLGCHLLTGGGTGVMAAAARSFVAVAGRRGLSIGVLPADPATVADEAATPAPPPGYPNPWIEVAIATHLPRDGVRGTETTSRNRVNVLSSTAVVALDGGPGTASEVTLALRWGRPLVAWLADPERELPLRTAGTPVARTLEEIETFLRAIIDRAPHR
jgi:uncharacterized protein (TIGR00725 family)